MTQEELLSLIGMGPSPYTSSEYSSQGVPGAPLPPVGQPGDTVSVWGNPDAPAPGQTPLTQEQGFGALPPAQPPAAPAILPAKVSVDQSSSGYSADKANQIEAGPYGTKAAKSKDAGIRQEIEQRYAPFYKEMAGVTAELRAAEDAASQAEQAKIQAKAAGDLKISTMMAEHGNKMQKLNESALIAAQAAKDEYKARLLSIPEVNPTALWDNAGGEGRFAVGVAAFVHDFLGAKGIKTSAMDTINQAVSNNINAQIANINTKKQVAQGFKDLYDMTVQESASQMEVQAKLQGYMLKSLEAGIDAQMGQYDSNVARAKHLQAKAGIRQLQLKNMMEVEQHIDNAFNQAVGHEVTREGQRIQASVAHERAKTDIEVAKIHANAAKNKEVKLGAPIFDNTKSGQGQLKWRIRPEFADDKELVRDVTGKVNASRSAVDGLNEVLRLQKQISDETARGTAPSILGRMRSELSRQEEAARNAIMASMLLNETGKVANAGELERLKSRIPPADWFTNGDNVKIISGEIQRKLNEANGLIKTYGKDVTPDDPEYGTKSASGVYGEGEGIEASKLVSPENPSKSNSLLEKAKAPDALKLLDTESMTPVEQSEYKEFTQKYWVDFKKEHPNVKAYQNIGTVKVGGEGVPKVFNDIREFAEEAFHGNAEARADLEALTVVRPDDTGKNKPAVAEMARYFLNKLDTAASVPGRQSQEYGMNTEDSGPYIGNDVQTVRPR